MTLHSFFLGGSVLRVAMFGLGLAYCVRLRQIWSLTALTHVSSIAVLVLLVVSREWATLLGIPVSAFVVWLLTDQARLRKENMRTQSLIEDQHAINEHLLRQLSRQ